MGMKRSEKRKGKEKAAARKRGYLRYGIIAAAGVAAIAIVLFFLLNPAGAKAGDTVSVIYIGTLDNGTVFDSNVNKTPLSFTLGSHTVIPGFEDAVTGMSRDQVKTVHIPADKAYGQYQSDLVRTVNRSLFGPEVTPETGMYYTFSNPADGSTSIVKVTNVTRDTVTIDQNHMLAGQNLTFMIRLIGIGAVQ
jgi:FKBP-type peptidyl-prolyl cis-trans isomerase 2